MHLLVLSAFRRSVLVGKVRSASLNAPFGAQCFPTPLGGVMWEAVCRLNAPFGAQCFPTSHLLGPQGREGPGLNAPFGAQCFPTWVR